MKKLTISLLLLSVLCHAADAPKVDHQAQYTSALLQIANLQTQRVELLRQIEEANREYTASVARLQKLAQSIVQAKQAECAADKKQLNSKALEESGAMNCIPNEG